jgi:hypothetical protein
MHTRIALGAALLALGGASAGIVAGAGTGADGTATTQRPLELAKSDLFIEINATDGDAGLQLDLDGEPWSQLAIFDPNGRRVMEVAGQGRLRGYGLTGLTFESAEPPFDEVPFARFRARFPEGRYVFRGRTVEGRPLVGAARLTHHIPKGPVLVFPAEDAVVAPEQLVIRWRAAGEPRGVEIVRYQVIVIHERSDREVAIDLPATATSATVPPEFLSPAGEYKVEVLARERSGNQTITEVPFTVGPSAP